MSRNAFDEHFPDDLADPVLAERYNAAYRRVAGLSAGPRVPRRAGGHVTGAATLSADGRYRYRLERTWSTAARTATWIMLNPSTADAATDDPTIRRVVGLTRRDPTFGRAVVVNLFAWRATSPRTLRDVDDPVGPANNQHTIEAVRDACRTGGLVVAAWGAHAARTPERVAAVARVLPLATVCLGRTKGGHPRHPLYVPQSTPFVYLRVNDPTDTEPS